MLGVEPERVRLDHVGLNHLTWERRVLVDGQDRLPELLGGHLEEIADDLELPAWLLRQLGVVPSYYLRYFYAHDEVVRELQSSPSRAAQVAEIERELLRMYADPAARHQAGAADPAGRRLLLRGRGGAVRPAARQLDGGGGAGGERPQR